jgi:tRNA U34 5-carboxymethylaminomethyl modifying GTPase MnmE/TrmE
MPMDPNLTHDLDTVVARATPEGEGGLAVVRLSGPQALAIASRVFRGAGYGQGSGEPGPGPDPAAPGDSVAPGAGEGSRKDSGPTPRRAVYGIFHEPVDAQHEDPQALAVIDESLALWLPGPHSYTGEDTVEFFCHGGRQVTAAVVRACQKAGAVAAAPGEFTRRAFLNGRLSLDQAEAVADLIQAGSEQAARAAVAQLRGGLDAELGALEWPLLDLLVRLEGSLEFSDDDSDEAVVDAAEIRLVLSEALDGVDQLLTLAPAGRLLREGVHVALAGAPNAGKSSLFNRLVGSDRALVDAEPGTTRDIVTAPVRRGGRLYVFHDTAGLREPAGRVESMGIARAREAADQADLVLVLAALGDGVVVWPEVGGRGDGATAAGSTCAGASDGGECDLRRRKWWRGSWPDLRRRNQWRKCGRPIGSHLRRPAAGAVCPDEVRPDLGRHNRHRFLRHGRSRHLRRRKSPRRHRHLEPDRRGRGGSVGGHRTPGGGVAAR